MALGKVKELVSSNPVVIFSNKLCPHCVCVKQLFVQQALCVAKLKVLFNNNHKGAVSPPQVSFMSQYLSIHYNFEDQFTLPNSSVDVGPRLQFRASHDLKAQQGEATMVAKLADPGYAFQLSSSFHSVGLVIGAVGFMNQRLEIPKDVDPKWASIIESCWHSDPANQPTFLELLSDTSTWPCFCSLGFIISFTTLVEEAATLRYFHLFYSSRQRTQLRRAKPGACGGR